MARVIRMALRREQLGRRFCFKGEREDTRSSCKVNLGSAKSSCDNEERRKVLAGNKKHKKRFT